MAVVLGLVYAVVGTVGFAVSGLDGFAATRGDRLIIFEVNPLQNLIHLALGWWLVNAGAAGEAAGKRATMAAAAILLSLGVAGLIVFPVRPEMNVINANRSVAIGQSISALLALTALASTRNPTRGA